MPLCTSCRHVRGSGVVAPFFLNLVGARWNVNYLTPCPLYPAERVSYTLEQEVDGYLSRSDALETRKSLPFVGNDITTVQLCSP